MAFTYFKASAVWPNSIAASAALRYTSPKRNRIHHISLCRPRLLDPGAGSIYFLKLNPVLETSRPVRCGPLRPVINLLSPVGYLVPPHNTPKLSSMVVYEFVAAFQTMIPACKLTGAPLKVVPG